MPLERKTKKKTSKVIAADSVKNAADHPPETIPMNQPEKTKPPRRIWNWTTLADATTHGHPPIFTRDGSHFFSIVGSTIKIYSTASGQVISTLPRSQDEGHSDIITSAIINAQNVFQLITASLDGTIKIWDFLEGVLLRTIGIDQPIHRVCTHEKTKDYLFVAAIKSKKSKGASPDEVPLMRYAEDSCIVLRVSLKTQGQGSPEKPQIPSQMLPIGKTRASAGIAVSASGEHLIVIAGRKAYVASVSNLKAGFTKFVSPENLTCLAVHPSEDYFATGDATGVVRLWYCLDPTLVKVVGVEKKSQTSTLHWHAHAVSSVAFTTNGAYLLSGGEESVLVLWQLHSGKREFIPRVGSPIKDIVVSPSKAKEEEYLLGLSDASYAFVSSSTLKLSRVFARVKLDPTIPIPRASSSSLPLAFHQPSETLVLPSSHPSSIQIYSPSTFTLVAELEVSPSNRVARRGEKILEPARVERIDISSNGEWMATIDRREGDESFRGEIYLKFWHWDKKSAFWILNTRIDRPHGLATVTSLLFSRGTEDVQLMTTGEDGNVKAWRIRIIKDRKGNEEVSWTSRSSFKLRSDIPRHISWSRDGSLLAVSTGSSVVLYDPYTNAVQQSFTIQECRHPSQVHFIGNSGRYLVILGGVELVVWDVVTQSVVWHLRSRYRYSGLVPHPHQDTFITIHSTGSKVAPSTVTILHASSPSPLMEYDLPFDILNVAWFFKPSGPLSSDFSLVAFTYTYSVVAFGDNIVLPEDTGASAKALEKRRAEPRRTLFEEMFGVAAVVDTSKQRPGRDADADGGAALPWRGSETASFFDAPSHLLPPIETFFDSLIDSFVRLRTNDNEAAVQAEDKTVEEEDEMVVDDFDEGGLVNVSADAVLNEFVPLFKQIADAPDYPYRSGKAAPLRAVNGVNGTPTKHHKPVAISNPKKPSQVESDIPPPIPSQTTPSTITKAGRKRNRPSLG